MKAVDLTLKQLKKIFSDANDFYNERNYLHISGAWFDAIVMFLNQSGYEVVSKEKISKVPKPYRDFLSE